MATGNPFSLHQGIIAPEAENDELEERAAEIAEGNDCSMGEARDKVWNEIPDKDYWNAEVTGIISDDVVEVRYVNDKGKVWGSRRRYHISYVSVPGAPGTLESDQEEYDVEDKNEKEDGTDENTNTPQKNDTLSNQKNDSQPLGINNNGIHNSGDDTGGGAADGGGDIVAGGGGGGSTNNEMQLASPPLVDENGHPLAEYERLRLRNIQRNKARLASLGLLNPGQRAGSAARNGGGSNVDPLLEEGAKSGCEKCKKELKTGERRRGDRHDLNCPRKPSNREAQKNQQAEIDALQLYAERPKRGNNDDARPTVLEGAKSGCQKCTEEYECEVVDPESIHDDCCPLSLVDSNKKLKSSEDKDDDTRSYKTVEGEKEGGDSTTPSDNPPQPILRHNWLPVPDHTGKVVGYILNGTKHLYGPGSTGRWVYMSLDKSNESNLPPKADELVLLESNETSTATAMDQSVNNNMESASGNAVEVRNVSQPSSSASSSAQVSSSSTIPSNNNTTVVDQSINSTTPAARGRQQMETEIVPPSSFTTGTQLSSVSSMSAQSSGGGIQVQPPIPNQDGLHPSGPQGQPGQEQQQQPDLAAAAPPSGGDGSGNIGGDQRQVQGQGPTLDERFKQAWLNNHTSHHQQQQPGASVPPSGASTGAHSTADVSRQQQPRLVAAAQPSGVADQREVQEQTGAHSHQQQQLGLATAAQSSGVDGSGNVGGDQRQVQGQGPTFGVVPQQPRLAAAAPPSGVTANQRPVYQQPPHAAASQQPFPRTQGIQPTSIHEVPQQQPSTTAPAEQNNGLMMPVPQNNGVVPPNSINQSFHGGQYGAPNGYWGGPMGGPNWGPPHPMNGGYNGNLNNNPNWGWMGPPPMNGGPNNNWGPNNGMMGPPPPGGGFGYQPYHQGPPPSTSYGNGYGPPHGYPPHHPPLPQNNGNYHMSSHNEHPRQPPPRMFNSKYSDIQNGNVPADDDHLEMQANFQMKQFQQQQQQQNRGPY